MIGGNLSNCLEAWKSISCNKTVLDWLTYGVPLDFNVQPGQFEEQNNIFSHKETLFLDSEILKFLNYCKVGVYARPGLYRTVYHIFLQCPSRTVLFV